MKRVTIFTSPKPFLNAHIDMIQKNAIRSWIAAGEHVDVVIVGEEPGLAEAIKGLPVIYVPDVERNEQGTPYVSSIFSQARKAGEGKILFYVNADIILQADVFDVIERIASQEPEFLLIGRRWDLDVNQDLFSEGSLESLSNEYIERFGRLSLLTAMDYFIFPRHLYRSIPDFAVGRAGWDNWMVYHGFRQEWPVIDITPSVKVIHQKHDYSHLPAGKSHHKLDESIQNVRLAGGMQTLYDLLDIRIEFRDGEIVRKKYSFAWLLRKIERWVTPPKQTGWRWSLTIRLRKLRKLVSSRWS